jgi:hypothetical protein
VVGRLPVLVGQGRVRAAVRPVTRADAIERVRAVQARLEDGLAAMRSQLTPGQRWTSALGISLVLLLLLFGLPTKVTVVPGASATPAPAVPPRDDRLTTPAAGPAEVTAAPPAVVPTRAGPPRPPLPAASPPPLPDLAPAPPPLDVVAVAVEGGGLPGRDDVAMAEVFAASARYPLPVISAGDDLDAACAEALAMAAVVVAGARLPEELRRCLLEGGATVLAFDGAETEPAAGSGRLVTTRRVLRHSLLDLARWGTAARTIRGRVGVVAGAKAQPVVEALVPELEALGVELVETAFVESGPSGTGAINEGVRRFASAGVSTVLLAAPMEVQRAWVAQQGVLLPGARSLVSDAFDAVVDELYPVTFEGTLAHTSLREPWAAREAGESDEQAECLRIWEAAARTTLRSERVPVFAWCQHVALVGAALDAAGSGGDLTEALLAQTAASPLTSGLGPLEEGGYGPRQDAVLVWRAACRCWESQQQFVGRPPR